MTCRTTSGSLDPHETRMALPVWQGLGIELLQGLAAHLLSPVSAKVEVWRPRK